MENWDDFNEEESFEKIDYWKILDSLDKSEILQKLNKIVQKDPKGKQMSEWVKKHRRGIFESYMNGLKEGKHDAFLISLHDFGLFVYIATNTKGNEKKEKVELNPKSLKLQKELDELYTEENINKAIEDLGIFVDGENDDK